MPEAPQVSIVIPCYNEEQRIGRSLERLQAWIATRSETFEIVVVNDGSTDQTSATVRSVPAPHAPVDLLESDSNRGKGATVQRGMLQARGNVVLFTDADLATPPEEIPRLLDALATSPVAIGIRIHPDGTDMRAASQPLYRRLLGKMFTWLANVLVVRGFPDTQCGFKGFHREAARAIFSRIQTVGIVFDVEVLCLARLLGYPVAQVPIQWRDPGGSRMMVRTEKAVEVFGALLQIRRRLRNSRTPFLDDQGISN